MSSQQPNAWQTAGGPRNSHSTSRTAQNRSGAASPGQQAQPAQSPRYETGRPQPLVSNVWASSSSSAGGSNGPSRAEAAAASLDDQHKPVNGFNAAEVKASLSRETAPQVYRPAEAAGAGRGGGAWGSKPTYMANNQPFFVQLAKQVAAMENGG